MKRAWAHFRWAWMTAAFVWLSITAGVGFARLEPSGRKGGLVQFDVVSELNMEESFTKTVVFARYWVCPDYYAVSVVWTEPHGKGLMDMKTMVVLSDETTFRMQDELYSFWTPTNTTYPKPVGERGPFRWGGGMYESAEMRFADAEAVARRVYLADLGSVKDGGQDANRVVDSKVTQGPGGVKRKLTRLKAQVKGSRIESMELFDDHQQSLGRMRYEYEPDGTASPLARLVADLPVRAEKLARNVNLTSISPSGEKTMVPVTIADHVYHKGGRTCTVTYGDVTIGDRVLRLPVQVEARASDDKRLLRSAKLLNFQRVDLDKAGVWEAAKAFAHLSEQDWTRMRLAGKYLEHKARLGPLKVDPNDLAFLRKLVAKYPLPGPTRQDAKARAGVTTEPGDLTPETRVEQARRRAEGGPQAPAPKLPSDRVEDLKLKRVVKMPEPARKDIEPNDARVIRQLVAHFRKERQAEMPEEAKRQGGGVTRVVPESERERFRLQNDLRRILAYHRAPVLPEDKTPALEPNDLAQIRKLQEHYERLATQADRGLGGQLKALHDLTVLDRILKDYDALEGHTARYLQMVQRAKLLAIYMNGAHRDMEILVEAGQYEKANKLLRQWADQSAAANDAQVILRFAGWDVEGSKRDPWASIQLLDQFLKKPGLSPLEKYEGLALRAIALHKVDRLLADPEGVESDLGRAQAQWVLSTTRRLEVARRVEPALQEALAAWQALGPARESEAKPYSTTNVPPVMMNRRGYPNATRLQETSALLDRIIRERTGNTRPAQPKTRR